MRSPDRLLDAPRRRRRRRRSRRGRPDNGRRLPLALVPVLAVVVLGFVAVQWLRPAPPVAVHASAISPSVPGALRLPWPSSGEAALAVSGAGWVGSSGGDAPVPIASITKVMTALVVLHDHPLSPGQDGPSLGITAPDVDQYQQDAATGQSVLAVATGEQLTELQALEGLLVPSANNMAAVLAQWDDGSVTAFVAAMNREAGALGLHQTRFVSPTGLEPGSVSTPEDLVRLGEAAMAQPVLAAVVGMPTVTLPVAGTVENYDYDLTHDGFVGIKTGSDTAAGGCFLFEAQVPVGGRPLAVVGAVLGQQAAPIIQSALDAASGLVSAFAPQLAVRTLVDAGQRLGWLRTDWGASTALVAGSSLSSVAWPGMAVTMHLRVARPTAGLRRGDRVGTLTVVADGTTRRLAVLTAGPLPGPSLGWKLGNL